MNPENVPPWGCPWHGLVKDGQLQLPNGASMSYPQPPGFGWRAGSAALIARPGVPAVNTSPDQTALGMEWRNTAILSGQAQLYGKQLGASSWIYIDADGNRWRVRTTLSSVNLKTPPATVTVSLAKFGVLGGVSEQHVYSIALPDIGQSTPDIGSINYIGAVTFDLTPTGSRAIFMVHTDWRTPASGPQALDSFGNVPVGWLELELSGPGHECAPIIRTLKTRAQTLGAVTAESHEQSSYRVKFTEKSDIEFEDADNYVITTTHALTPDDDGELSFAVAESSFRRSVVGYVLALWYSGSRVEELTFSATDQTTASAEVPALTSGESKSTVIGGGAPIYEWLSDAVATYTATSICSTELSFFVDGVKTGGVAYGTEITLSSVHSRTEGGDSFSRVTTYNYNGATETTTVDDADWFPHRSNGISIVAHVSVPDGSQWQPWFNYVAFFPRPGGKQYVASVLRASNKVFSLCMSDGATLDVVTPLTTAIGPAAPAIPPHGFGGYGEPALFASLCPVTDQLAISAEPVCWV